MALSSGPATSQIKRVRVVCETATNGSCEKYKSGKMWQFGHLFSHLPRNSNSAQRSLMSDGSPPVGSSPVITSENQSGSQEQFIGAPSSLCLERKSQKGVLGVKRGKCSHQPITAGFLRSLLTVHKVSIAAEGCHGNSSLCIFWMRTHKYRARGFRKPYCMCLLLSLVPRGRN